MSRFALRNNLYYKYSSILSGGKKPEINRNIDYYYQNRKTEDSKQNFSYSEPNNNFNFINMHKRNLNLPNLKNNQHFPNFLPKLIVYIIQAGHNLVLSYQYLSLYQ